MICVWYRMRKRSIPQLRITINPCCWMFRVRRGYMPRLRVSISSYVGYLMLRFFLIYAYVVTCICIWSYMCDKYTYVYVSYNVISTSNVVLFGGRILVAVLTFLWEWRSHHPFFNNFFLLTSPLVTSISLRNDTFMATMMLRT